MRIVVDLNHPAHVHYSKNFIREMTRRGHQVLITVTEKDIACSLLDRYKLKYIRLGSYGSSLISKIISFPLINLKMYLAVKNFQPDMFLGFGSIRAAQVAYLLRKPCINFEDTEHSSGQISMYLPFVSAVCTPQCFTDDLGPKQIRFDGYLELAALHPNRFTPDPAVLAEIGLNERDPFIIIRFVSWMASHDIGQHGILDKAGLVKALETYGRVLITSEGALPAELQSYQIRVSPEKLHDLLSYAALYVGEGATTASECAVLGTHAIYVNTLPLGYIAEESERYDLVSDFSVRDCTDETVLAEARKLLGNTDLKQIGKKKRENLLKDKIDVTAFMVWFIEHYPDSVDVMKKNPGIQQQFGSHS